jgi:hypothetical protein
MAPWRDRHGSGQENHTMTDALRIANCSGFYGDRLSAAREMVEGGPIDVLTGDYLAELTMMVLFKNRMKDARFGYARTFLTQLEAVAASAAAKGIRIVVNAGGLNPKGCADAARAVYEKLGLRANIAYVEGDDLMPRLAELRAGGEAFTHLDRGLPLSTLSLPIVTANAYLGGWGIATALERGADVVICGRVTDAALVVGPAAWKFGWARDDWDRLASAVVAGHIIECGPQCTGGNYSFFKEVPGLRHPGFPIAEMQDDGTFVVTKHPNTGGIVTVGTVTAQLLYEIGGAEYPNPDVVARFDTIRLSQEGPDRVRVSGVRGEPAPERLKVCINHLGGFRNSMTFVLTGLDIEEKAKLAEGTIWELVGGREQFAETHVSLRRSSQPNPASNEDAFAFLTIAVKDDDAKKVGRAFSGKGIEMALSSYPGFSMSGLPKDEQQFGVYWPALVSASAASHRVVLGDGESIAVEHTVAARAGFDRPASPGGPDCALPTGPTRALPLGAVCGSRSGDKGGNANLGVWVESDAAYVWLESFLTVARLKELLPEVRALEVERHALPRILAVNFVVKGLLGDGVAASLRSDPQAKTLGEYLRAKVVAVPVELLAR